MALTPEEVHYIARLARLSFSEEEVGRLAHELNDILAYVAQLDELDTTDVPPMAHVLDLHNVFRPDEVVPRLSHEAALREAPDADADFFRVPKVIDSFF